MKTEAVLKKYTKIIFSILQCEPKDIVFLVDNREIKEIKYLEPEKDKDGNVTGKQNEQAYWREWSEGKYKVMIKNKKLSTFELYKMPHCCAILVSCQAFVAEEFRNKRIGTVLNDFRQDIGRLLGYSLLFCTDIEQNKHQRKLLKTNGWKDIYDVVNKRTKNRVYLSVINL